MILDAFPKTNSEKIMDMSVMAINHHIELIEEAAELDPVLAAMDLPFISFFRQKLAKLEFRMMTYDKELRDLEKLTREGKL